MTDTSTQNGMAAEAYIARLGARGIEYVFANAGTDFAPIVEALSQTKDAKAPRFMVVPHENVAMAMAHGYYRISGKPAAVMVHVTVGTANAINGIINASRDNIPAAGDTPVLFRSVPPQRLTFIDSGAPPGHLVPPLPIEWIRP